MTILNFLAMVVGMIGIAIIILGLSIGLARLVLTEFNSLKPIRKHTMSLDEIRSDIGRHMLLGLDFLVASDLILTVVRPTLEELAILGGLVVIRVVIGYFRHREMGKGDNIS